jgi:hypothetical protein
MRFGSERLEICASDALRICPNDGCWQSVEETVTSQFVEITIRLTFKSSNSKCLPISEIEIVIGQLVVDRPMSDSENDVHGFLDLLARSCNPEIPQEQSIAFFRSARHYPQALARCLHVLQNPEVFGDAARLLVYGFLKGQYVECHAGTRLFRFRPPPPEMPAAFFDLLRSMLDATDRLTTANFGIVRCTFAAIARRVVVSTGATNDLFRFSDTALALLGTDNPELILGGLRLCKGIALVYSRLPECLEAYSNFIHIFQEHVRTFFQPSLFSDPRVHIIGKRVLSVWNLAVSHMCQLLL